MKNPRRRTGTEIPSRPAAREKPATANDDLPWVFVNMAISADGKIASQRRQLTSFGSSWDERHLYELRSTADAILCGARTIEQSHSTLGNGPDSWTRRRLRGGLKRYPVRVVVSGSGTISRSAELWSHEFGPIVVATTSRASKTKLDWLRRYAAAVWVTEADEIDWSQCLRRLHLEFGVRRALSEGGGELNDALFRARLVQELHLTWCPWVLGGRYAPTLADGRGQAMLAAAAKGSLVRCRRIGNEVALTYRF